MSMAVDIDGHMPLAAANSNNEDVWQTENLRALVNFYVAYYEQGEQKMWQEFTQYCQPLTYCLDLTGLFKRYLEYKTQLQELDTEPLELASEFEDRLDELDLLRYKLFSSFEISLLFNNQETWDRYAIKRLRIIQDASLNRQQKAQLINQQFEHLPEQMKQAVRSAQG